MNIFCDLDGVLVDLCKKMNAIYGYDTKNEFVKHFDTHMKTLDKKEKVEFWQNLEKTEECDTIWNMISKYNPMILTSCSGCTNAIEGKKLWCQKNLGLPHYRVICVHRSDQKRLYANKGRVLIDDLECNINDWKSFGGTAIHHLNITDTIRQLESILS